MHNNSRIPRAALLVLAGAAVLAASAVAAPIAAAPIALAPAGSDPLTLVLQRSDFPASAKWTNGRMPASFERGMAAAGVPGRAAFFSTSLPKGAAKTQTVNGLVMVLRSPRDARRAFALFKQDLAPRPRDIVRLPAYGDEQVATARTRPVEKGEVLVRRGAVVWQLEIGAMGVLALSRSQVLSELRTYAAKQKRPGGIRLTTCSRRSLRRPAGRALATACV
jgi:hypothetical protein